MKERDGAPDSYDFVVISISSKKKSLQSFVKISVFKTKESFIMRLGSQCRSH